METVQDPDAKIVEALAEQAHIAWSGWMNYMFEKSIETSDGAVIIPVELVQRWKRQKGTLYFALPEGEKESDREEARHYLAALAKAGAKFEPFPPLTIPEIMREMRSAKWSQDMKDSDLKKIAFAVLYVKYFSQSEALADHGWDYLIQAQMANQAHKRETGKELFLM